MHPSHIMTQRENIRNNLNKFDWEITKDKCDSKLAHRPHLAANGKHENKRKIYCTNVHLRIIEILITLMYKLSAVTAAVTGLRYCVSAIEAGQVYGAGGRVSELWRVPQGMGDGGALEACVPLCPGGGGEGGRRGGGGGCRAVCDVL